MMVDYESFLAAARQAEPGPRFWHELQSLYAEPGGTLRVLVHMFLQHRDVLVEALVKTHMVNEEAIRKAVGTQGQLSGIDLLLQEIFEAMRKPNEPADEVSAEQRGAAP